jgi:hypothetical protein
MKMRSGVSGIASRKSRIPGTNYSRHLAGEATVESGLVEGLNKLPASRWVN